MFFGLFKKKKRETQTDLDSLTIRKLSQIKKRFSQKNLDQLSFIFRTYLQEKFDLKKSLTPEEILIEIENKRIKKQIRNMLKEFSNEIAEIEFAEKKITKKQYTDLIEKLQTIIKLV